MSLKYEPSLEPLHTSNPNPQQVRAKALGALAAALRSPAVARAWVAAQVPYMCTRIYIRAPSFRGAQHATLPLLSEEERPEQVLRPYLTGRAKIWPRLSFMCHIFSTAGCWCVAALVSVFWVSIYCHALNHSAACRMLSAQFLLICGLMRSHVERRCSHLGPTQNFKSPSILEYTNSIRSTAKFRTRNAEYETPPRTHSKIRKPQIIHTHPRCVSYG